MPDIHCRLLRIPGGNVGPIYGLMLTAWGFRDAFGPTAIALHAANNGSYSLERSTLSRRLWRFFRCSCLSLFIRQKRIEGDRQQGSGRN